MNDLERRRFQVAEGRRVHRRIGAEEGDEDIQRRSAREVTTVVKRSPTRRRIHQINQIIVLNSVEFDLLEDLLHYEIRAFRMNMEGIEFSVDIASSVIEMSKCDLFHCA